MASDDLEDSSFVKLAGALMGGNEEELRETLADEVIPNASGQAVDATLSGTILGLARSELTEAMAQAEEHAEHPVTHFREKEFQDGTTGLHVFVSDPDARLFKSDQSVLVIAGEWRDEQYVGFEPGRIEELQGEAEQDTVAEFMVYPESRTITTDMPPEEAEESDTSDTSGIESSEDDGGVELSDEQPVQEKPPEEMYPDRNEVEDIIEEAEDADDADE